MHRIKIVGALIFILSLSLALLSNSMSHTNQLNSKILSSINEQKAFTQEISKNIFYIYKNKNASTKQLNDSIKVFIENMAKEDMKLSYITSLNNQEQIQEILFLWNEFYLKVQKFRDMSSVTTTYSNVILEKIVKDIYNINLKLVVGFDRLLKSNQKEFAESQRVEKFLQYALFSLLLLLLLYLFTQLKTVIFFVQEFLSTSKNIIKNSTIKELKPIEVAQSSADIIKASNNFNFLVQKIDNSIEYSSRSIAHSFESIELVERNIEELLELLYSMEEGREFDKQMTQKEDTLIQTLEELSRSSKRLEDLKIDLDNFLIHKKEI